MANRVEPLIETALAKLSQIVKEAEEAQAKCEKCLVEIISRGEDHNGGAHVEADEALCELLKSFDCEKAVYLFEKIDKWYS